MYIPRILEPRLQKALIGKQRGIVLYGSRQVGKTTLVTSLLQKLGHKTLTLNGDQRGPWWDNLVSRDIIRLRGLVTGYKVIFIDEAQRIPEVGLTAKILLDSFPELIVILTGSSSLDLASKVSEPLTGRVYHYRLYPISQQELAAQQTLYEREQELENRLIFGSYPKIFSISANEQRREYLEHLVNGYLYKDLLEFGGIRNSSKIYDLLRLIGFQTGSEVSISELSRNLEVAKGTVERYIDLLEKSFVLFRVSGFSKNLRKEVHKMAKIYFYDTGVRNSIIGNLNPLSSRNDIGQLWENFLMIERKKRMEYESSLYQQRFWRTHTGAELDLIEERDGNLFGFEFKWGEKVGRLPHTFLTVYPHATATVINKTNYESFITKAPYFR